MKGLIKWVIIFFFQNFKVTVFEVSPITLTPFLKNISLSDNYFFKI